MNTKFKLGYSVKIVLSRQTSPSDDPDRILQFGKIVKVHLSEGKTTYDVEFTLSVDLEAKKRKTTRLHNVDEEILELQINSETRLPFTATKETHSFGEWVEHYKKVLFREGESIQIDEESYQGYYDDGLTPEETYKEELYASQ